MSLGIQLSTPRTLRFSTEIFSLYVLLLLTDCLRQQTTGNFIDNSTDCCFPGFHFRKFFKKLQSEPLKIHENQFYLYYLTQPSCHVVMICYVTESDIDLVCHRYVTLSFGIRRIFFNYQKRKDLEKLKKLTRELSGLDVLEMEKFTTS